MQDSSNVIYQNRGDMMKLIHAKEVELDRINAFLRTTGQVDKESLLKDGYVIEVAGSIQGSFILAAVDDGVFWLKQLYIAKESANSLPAILETILVLAKMKQAKKVYVHSHQPLVDILLGALQFHPQKEALEVSHVERKKGNWWAYEVS